MRIGFDAKRIFNNYTGLGNYSRSLVSGLVNFFPKNQYVLFTPKASENPVTQPFFNPPYKIVVPKKKFTKLWRSYQIAEDLSRENIDIYHGLSNELPFSIHRSGVKCVVTIHDLIFRILPHHYPIMDRHIYDIKFRYASKAATKVIAISESTKEDIVDFYGIPQEKIHVVYQSCNDSFRAEVSQHQKEELKKLYNLPQNFLLYVGSITERKNLLVVVKALALIPTENRPMLIVVGSGKGYKKKVLRFINQKNLQNFVKFFSGVPNEHLPALYQMADAFVYPSFYEGFGIPIIEALFSGTPVITAKTSSLPEAGGSFSRYIDPHSAEEMAEAICEVFSDKELSNKMSAEGLIYANRFLPENVITDTEKVYRELLTRH